MQFNQCCSNLPALEVESCHSHLRYTISALLSPDCAFHGTLQADQAFLSIHRQETQLFFRFQMAKRRYLFSAHHSRHFSYQYRWMLNFDLQEHLSFQHCFLIRFVVQAQVLRSQNQRQELKYYLYHFHFSILLHLTPLCSDQTLHYFYLHLRQHLAPQ